VTDVRRVGCSSPGTTGVRVSAMARFIQPTFPGKETFVGDASATGLWHDQQRGGGSQSTQDTHITRVIASISEIDMRSARSVFVDEALRDNLFACRIASSTTHD
jgi:hypothetical protein